MSVTFDPDNGRWNYNKILHESDSDAKLVYTSASVDGKAITQQTDQSTIYTQKLKHPRLKWLIRQLEIYLSHPMATLKIRLYRNSSELPEWFYIGCSFPTKEILPTTTCGGMPFQPFVDQLPNTCRDFFAIDSWVSYQTDRSGRTWISKDSSLVGIGGPQPLRYLTEIPQQPNRLYALVFDNTWMTNFVCDEHGIFAFQFDLVQHAPLSPVALDAMSETILSIPSFIIQPNFPENPSMMERLFKP